VQLAFPISAARRRQRSDALARYLKMIRAIGIVLLASILAACRTGPAGSDRAAAGARYSGGDGTTLERAVIIAGANEMTGIDAEYAWLQQHVPGGKVTRQELITRGRRAYDKLDVTLPEGGGKSFYFDISGGYGKLL
jgi:hypothetical protein